MVANSMLPMEIDDELVSRVRATCAEFGVALEDLVKDYLDFVTDLDDEAVVQLQAFSNEDDKADWLAKYYLRGKRK